MPQSLSKIYIHAIFSTKNREFLIDDNVEHELWQVIGGLINQTGSKVIKVGGFLNHVHILFDLARTSTVAKTLEIVKSLSSKWIKTRGPQYDGFFWQNGYAAFSVEPNRVKSLIKYIETQRAHHQNLIYQDEVRKFFKESGTEYDERYAWD